MDQNFTEREQIVEVLNKLFVFTDGKEWRRLINEVFAHYVWLDMTSMGGTAEKITSTQICNMWEEGFKDLDAVHHQAGTYIISIDGASAEANGYSIASHYKEKANNGKTREFIGSYEFGLTKEDGEWKINKMKYNLKYMTGNADLS